MNNERFEELKGMLPTTLRVKLDRICRYLSQNMASVMVGAGFSLNAKKLNPAARMMKWSDLVKTFWDLLYPGMPLNMELTTPMHLASLLEAQSGRSELDNQIANSLPDNELEPGDLHIAMMKLPWRDVFTTNYDRLLERAGEKTGRKYNLVTNRSTLIYTQSPRIVKLHGSFPDIRPFIMTEDDFRTYPDEYPEFVNTVRQALIENLFCLVGFSGEDPNFLSWLGWLRDVMGELMSPVYLIDYKENIQDADIKLNNFRKVDVVNLYEIPTIKGFTEALTFFFRYLQENMGEQKEWSAYLGVRPFETRKLTAVTKQMCEIRQGYPGWVFLPERYLRQFEELTDYFPYLGAKIDDLTEEEQLEFLYEIDWRVRITGSPCTMPWFVEKLKSFNLAAAKKEHIKKILSQRLTALAAYRYMLERERFEEVENELANYYSSHEDETIGRFYYERCLMGMVRGQFEKVRQLLDEWQVSDTDYQGLLWKASILNSVGETEKCVSLLDTVRNKVSVALLNTSGNREYLNSCTHMANLILRYYTPQVDIKSIDLYSQSGVDFDNLLYHLRLETEQQKGKTGTYDEHGYLLKEVNTVWRSDDRGFYKDYANAFRIMAQLDSVGHPLQVYGRPIRSNVLEQALTAMTKYDSGMVLSVLVRMSGDNWIRRSIITRELMRYVKVEEAALFFMEWIDECKKAINGREKDKTINRLVVNTIIPVLMMMSVKLSQEQLKELLKIYLKVYEQKEPSYQAKHLKLLYSCMEKKTLQAIIPIVYKTTMVDYGRMMDSHLVMPERGYEGVKVDATITRVLTEGFKSSIPFINSEAFVRFMSLCENMGNGWMTKELKNTVMAWRNRGQMGVMERQSYQYLPASGRVDKRAIEQVATEDVEKLMQTVFDKKQFGVKMMEFRDRLQIVSYEAQLLESKMNDIFEKTTDFLKLYEKQMLAVERGLDFSGDYQHVEYFFTVLKQLITSSKLKGVSAPTIQAMLDRLEKLSKKYELEYVIALLVVELHPTAEVFETLTKNMDIALFSGNRKKRQGAMRTLLKYAEFGADVTAVTQRVVQYLLTAQNDSVNDYLDYLTRLNEQGKLVVNDELLNALTAVLAKIDDSCFSVNAKMDIAYSGLVLTGKLAKKEKKAVKVYNAWKKYVDTPEMFNDVKVALEN